MLTDGERAAIGCEVSRPYTLRVTFDDGTEREIDVRPVLAGEIYGALQDEAFFNQVAIDPETHTLVWPNGADFDPETLHERPEYADALKRTASQWAMAHVKAQE
ncbi:MAG: DUF2442 domain-containing protein [Roseiflexaceae bacterium]|nr:DUF2442 domain-containing protein [Roseiflexaceae bacterium]